MADLLFLDYAATTPLRSEALEAMLPFLQRPGSNPSAGYASARRAKQALEDARAEIAQCIGAGPHEVYFTSGGTEADNWALRALLQQDKGHIVTSVAEHHAVLNTCEQLEREGCSVTRVPVDKYARVHASHVGAAIRDDTAVVSVMYANNETGAVNEMGSIAEQVHSRDVPLHCDCVAAAGHVPVSAERDGIDLMSLSAHKFYGPPGIGVLYVREGVPIRPFLSGGRQERGLRAGTQNVAGAVGMARALERACEEMKQETARLTALRRTFQEALVRAVPGVQFISPDDGMLPGTLSFFVPNLDAAAALIQLDRQGIEAASGAACSTGAGRPSHVLLAAGLTPEEARCVLRVSLGRGTKECDAGRFADSLADIASRVRPRTTRHAEPCGPSKV